MILEEYFNYRRELLDQSKDEEGFINQNMVLSEVLPSMMDAKLIDTEDYNNSYFYSYLCFIFIVSIIYFKFTTCTITFISKKCWWKYS